MSETNNGVQAAQAEYLELLNAMSTEDRKEVKATRRRDRVQAAHKVQRAVMADDSAREEDAEFYREAQAAVLQAYQVAGQSDEDAQAQYPLLFSTWEERQRHHELGMMMEGDPNSLRQSVRLEYRCRTRGCRLGGVLQMPDGRYWFRWSRVTLVPVVGSDIFPLLSRNDVPQSLRSRLEACVYAETMAEPYMPHTLSEARWLAEHVRGDYYPGVLELSSPSCTVAPLAYRTGTMDPYPYLQCPHVEADVSPERVAEDLRRVRGKRSPVVRL